MKPATILRRADLAYHLGALSRMGLLDGLLAIAKVHNVLFDDVLSANKSRMIMRARIACYLHLRGLDMSYPEIGRVMLRDHTTILYAVKRHHEQRPAEVPTTDHRNGHKR